MRRLARGAPTALSFGLLIFQVILPWTARCFITMDGPSHLYNARVIGEILFHRDSPYRKFYQLRPALTTNWGSVLLFNLVSRITVTHAEQVVASLSVLAAFACFLYLLRSLDSTAPLTPIINYLTITWFLWVGYYNFYLGMALFALAVGYYIRNSEGLTWRRAGVLSFLLVTVFFTHILPAALAMMTILIVAIWLHGFRRPKALLPLVIALLPAALLLGSFALASREGMAVKPDVLRAWKNFPSTVFTDTFRDSISGAYLYPAIAAFLLLGLALLRRTEWRSARGGLAAATAVCFGLYLVLPSHGFGGDDINTRMAWAVFILGCTAAAAGSRMQTVAPLAALYITAFLGIQLYQTMNRNVRSVSVAAEDYARATGAIPRGATVVRLRFDTVPMSRQYGFRGIPLDPMYHADAWMAARNSWVDLSDYQALSRVFALECKPPITDKQREDLWLLESGNYTSIVSFYRLMDSFPTPIDYLLVLGDSHAQYLTVDWWLEWQGGAGNGSFLSVYRRKGMPK